MSHQSAASWILGGLDRCVLLLSRFGLSESFIRFGMVGTSGFIWDTGTVYGLRLITNIYIAGICGFFVAASMNWGANRLWTFRHHTHAAPHVQWAKFLTANIIGFLVNRGIFLILVSKFNLCYQQPVIAIAAGSLAGLVFNYLLSKRFVFC